MALKSFFRVNRDAGWDIELTVNHEAEPGGVLSYVTGGSGIALDQSQRVASYSTTSSGKVPVGFLFGSIKTLDLSKYKLNNYKLEYPVGSKVPVITQGLLTTNMVYPGQSPTAGGDAYLGPSGLLVTSAANAVANPKVGVFDSIKDADGFVRVKFNLP